MKLRTRILRAVSGDAGPASKAVLRGIARAHGKLEQFAATFREMLKAGEIEMYGDKRGATYGAPRKRGLGFKDRETLRKAPTRSRRRHKEFDYRNLQSAAQARRHARARAA